MLSKQEIEMIINAFNVADHESQLSTEIASRIVDKFIEIHPDVVDKFSLYWYIPDWNKEPVTEERLKSLGFQEDKMGCPTLGNLHIQPNTRIEKGKEYPPYACIRSVPLKVPKNMGDLMKLIEFVK